MQTLPTAFLALCLAGAATLARAEDSAEKWMPLFDGKTLDGWSNPYEWGEAKAVDGEIHLKAQKKFFLVSDEKVKDFIFEGEILLPEGQANSGFMFRAHVEKNKVFGYQAEVDGSDRKWSGGLYDEGRRGWLHPFRADGKASDADKKRAKETQEAFKEVGTAFKRSDWNKYRIECRGNHLQIWVNGVQTTDYTDETDAEATSRSSTTAKRIRSIASATCASSTCPQEPRAKRVRKAMPGGRRCSATTAILARGTIRATAGRSRAASDPRSQGGRPAHQEILRGLRADLRVEDRGKREQRREVSLWRLRRQADRSGIPIARRC
ncbi:MAG: DUF1080 domain-containing protein [Verrucomicrobiales bacterium]